MKEFACGSVVPGCSAVFVGTDEDSILSQVARHAHEDHGLTEVTDELVAAVRSNIHALAA
jgi:predicted small metal-binding protein